MVDPGPPRPPAPYLAPPAATPAKNRLPIILGVLIGVLLLCCAALPAVVLAFGDGDDPAASATRDAPSKHATRGGPSERATGGGPTKRATPPPAAVPSKPAPTAVPADVTYKGRGKKVVRLKPLTSDYVAYATITHRGSSNFAVWSIGADGGHLDLIVNSVGAYKGSRPFNFTGEPATLRVEADGSWEIVVKSLRKAPVWPATTSGKGPLVLRVKPGTARAKLTYKGRSNFVVNVYGENPDLLVNVIGKYSGSVLLPDGTEVIAIDTDGAWTMKPA